MRTIPGRREKVTIYFTSELTGRVLRREGRLVQVEDFTDPGRAHRGADVILVGKGDRSAQRIASSSWVIVDGWGHPDPEPRQREAEDYRAHVPGSLEAFLAGAGVGLRPRYALARKSLLIAGAPPDGSGEDMTPAELEADVRRVTRP